VVNGNDKSSTWYFVRRTPDLGAELVQGTAVIPHERGECRDLLYLALELATGQ